MTGGVFIERSWQRMYWVDGRAIAYIFLTALGVYRFGWEALAPFTPSSQNQWRSKALNKAYISILFSSILHSLTTTMETQKRADWKTVDLQWNSEIGPISVDEVMKPTRDSTEEQKMIAKMWVMCAIEMQSKLQAATCTRPHFERYRSWLAAECERFKQPEYTQVPDSRELVTMSSEARLKAMNEMRESVKDTYMWPVIEGPWRVYDNVVDIVEGRAKLVKVLLKDGLLGKFYDWANGLSEVRPIFNLMGRSNSQLRILEIGAGTGGTTARALEGLKSDSGERLYSSYVFTDISPLFFDSARKRFEAYDNIEYRALDISRDPREQGFEEGAYDLVIASNVSLEKFLFDFSVLVQEIVVV
jgi:hypothetical protein